MIQKILIFVFVLSFLSCGRAEVGSSSSEVNSALFKDFTFPVYSGAIDLKAFVNKPAKGTRATSYKISAIFPAQSLTEFYNHEMEKRGFKKYRESIHALKEFEWNTFNYRTGDWEITTQPPARYSAMWVNEKQDEIVWLVIDFRPKSKDDSRNGTAFVSVHIAKFSVFTAEQKEVQQLIQKNGRKQD